MPHSEATDSGSSDGASAPAARRMRSEDVDSVAHVLTQAFAPPPGANPLGPRTLTSNHLVDRWHAQCAGAWVVDAPGFGPVGAVFAVVEPEVGWIAGLGVHPAYRGVGVGRALTTAALGFLENAGCAMVGLEASPNDAVALGAYARRGLRPVDVTLRLRASAAALATSGMPAELEVRSLDPQTGSSEPATDGSGGSETRPYTSGRAGAVPLSDAAFMAVGPGASVVCDPEAVPAGEVLEARLGSLGRNGHSVAAACRGLGRLAVAGQLRYVELDLAVGSGVGLAEVARLGFQTVASTVRLARPAAAYRQAADDGLELGRWSL